MKLQRVEVEGEVSHFFYCPGCKSLHRFTCNATGGRPNWTFDNGDTERPSFSPSLLIFTSRPRPGLPDDPNYDMKPGDWERVTLCHLFLKDGVLQFLGDCAHDLKNQNVPLADTPQEDLI